jgi:hypothetical protein
MLVKFELIVKTLRENVSQTLRTKILRTVDYHRCARYCTVKTSLCPWGNYDMFRPLGKELPPKEAHINRGDQLCSFSSSIS